MRVLICIPCLKNGGTEIQTLSLIKALCLAKHHVSVVCYFEHNAEMVERYKQTGANIEFLSIDGERPNSLKDQVKLLWNGFKKTIKEVHPDIVHVQYMAPGAIPIIILRLLGIKKIIATAHTSGDLYSKNGLRIIRLLSKTCLNAFQCITECAEKSFFGSSHIFDGKLSKHFTIYNNIPSHINILHNARVIKPNVSTITLGVVSRLEYIKGMDLVIPAFALASKCNSNLQLLIVGDGSQRELMEKQTHEHNVAGLVTFVGFKQQDELQDWYDSIDILLMPSRSEGFGLTAIEGMARGCVPVVANTGGLPEIVSANCGMLHNPEDIEDMAQKITEATKCIDLLSREAIAISQKFSTGEYNSQIEKLYSIL